MLRKYLVLSFLGKKTEWHYLKRTFTFIGNIKINDYWKSFFYLCPWVSSGIHIDTGILLSGVGIFFQKLGSSYQVIKSGSKRPVQVIKFSFFTKINLIQDQVIKLFDLGFNLGSSYHLILVQVIKLSKVVSHSIF